MNTKLFYLTFTIFLLVFITPSYTQSSFEIGFLPTINFNKKLEQDWSLNFQYATRHIVKTGEFGGVSSNNYNFDLSDYTLLGAKKINLNSKISGGFLYRRRNKETIIRSIQQFAIVQRLSRLRLSHRVVTDQTFRKNEETEFRLRYRIATEIPLNGDAADKQEFYIKLSNEYLNSWQSDIYDLEIRVIPMLGYIFTNGQKLELGLDYRVNSFVTSFAEHTFWTGINWYIQL